MRNLSGNDQFEALKSTVTDAYSKLFPVTNNGFELGLKKIWVDEAGLDLHDYEDQKKTRLAGNTWGAPVYASLDLKDKDGKIIDHLDKVRLSTIPKLTPRGSFIVGGNEYQVMNQMRRRPGVYVVKRTTGDQYKANFNLTGENSRNFEVHFDPKSTKYSIKKVAGSDSTIPLYSMLSALGVPDTQLIKEWGEDTFRANKAGATPATQIKLAKYITGKDQAGADEARTAIQDWAKQMKIDPHVAEVTHGHPHSTLTSQLILDTSKKLMGIYKGTHTADDPESLLFKEILGAEDMLHDKLNSKKQVVVMKNILTRNLGRKMTLREIIDFKKLASPVENFFISDNRTGLPEQHNPAQMLSNLYKLTLHGTGGITDPHTIVPEVREVHPSQLGFIDPVHTPESQKIGTMLHLTAGTQKEGRDVKTQVYNLKEKKLEFLAPRELYSKVVAFPDDVSFSDKGATFKNPQSVRIQHKGKLDTVRAGDVQYVLPTSNQLFSYSTNLIPFLHNDQGTRVMMGSKMLEQAMPLVEREAPLVQTDLGNGQSFHDLIGHQSAIHSPESGKVTKVTPDFIEINGKTRVKLYNHFPLNQKTFIHHEPKVAVGDSVKKGQLISDSNFTKNGTLALGKNLRVAYLPYPGLTFEDGIVITESAAKKLATTQMYKHTFQMEPDKRKLDLKLFTSYHPNVIAHKQIKDYDDEGVIKKGSILTPGQVVIAGMHNNVSSQENQSLKRINKSLQLPWGNSAVHYTGEFSGEVTDVVKRAGQVDVYVKAVEPARASDKLSGVHGNKGVITRVIPDAEAPHTKDGQIPDVFLNPHGVIGRINLGQLYESAASKIAKKTGKTYLVKNFNGEDSSQKLTEELKAQGIEDKEEFFLPDGKSLGKVQVGNPYILRLAKTGKSGFSARMPRSGYDLNMQPLKGGEEGTKSLDLMTFYSMLSHGAKKNLVDAHQKSEKNDEYWHAIEMGKTLPAPKPSFVWNKFMNLMRGAGIHPDKNGPTITLGPMTDKEVLKLSRGKITEPEFLYGKDLKEKKGGFFDPGITGGLLGERFSHLELNERHPNPIFEGAIKSLTGLKQAEYDDIIAGRKYVTHDGFVTKEKVDRAITGGEGISHLLGRIDIGSELKKSHSELATAKNATELNKVNKKIRYLTALKELNLSPSEAYTRKTIPVIPPIHRPIYEMPNRQLRVAPANELYKNVGILNKAHEHPVMMLLGDEDKQDLRQDLYKATRQLAGLESLETRGKDRPIEGFVSQITGSTPKSGFFLEKIINKRQDLVGRGVITSGPDLHVDELGIPEKMAWKIFRPFAIREYTASGIMPDVARKEMDEQNPRAKEMLLSAMRKRTVLMNRAPSLHKFSIMAFKPIMTQGLAVQVPPLVLKGFGGDYDGDAVTLHVPVSEEAVRESHRMFPSQNLYKPGTGELMIKPSQESAIGLYFMSQSAEGRAKINALLPESLHIKGALDKKAAHTLYEGLAHHDKQAFATTVTKMKHLGDRAAYDKGFSVGLEDVVADRRPRDVLMKAADTEVATLKAHHKKSPELDQKVANVYKAAVDQAYAGIKEKLKGGNNSFYHMVASGARGEDKQLRQLMAAPGILTNAKGTEIPVPVKKSYAEGLSTSDYFITAYGVRKGMMDRALQTSAPGALNKDIMASTIDNVVTHSDCGTDRGISLPVQSKDVLDRYLSRDQHQLKRNTLVTPQVVSFLAKSGIHNIDVRSPLKCLETHGTCAHCFGLDENGTMPVIGDNLGAKAGQSMSEPMTQMVMRTFHTGGVAGGPSVAGGFERVRQLLHMPEYVAGEAALATHPGKVTAIKPTTAGGHEIIVGDKVHTVRPGLPLKVKVGDYVAAGDTLSQGVIKPQDLVKYKGMAKAQDYVVDELQKTYHEQGVPIQRKMLETVVRSFGNLTRVLNAPKHLDVQPGQLIPFTVAEHYNEKRQTSVPVMEAQGYRLQKPTGPLPANHELQDKDLAHLRTLGYNQVDVLKDPLQHAPILKGLERLPMEKKNWMAQLGYRYIKDTLTEGAAQAWKSSVEGNHPIPAFAYGASFGKKKENY